MTKKFRPIRFKVEETKKYWLCNCKQTENSPYCDLTHRRQDIQDFIKSWSIQIHSVGVSNEVWDSKMADYL